VAVGEAPVAWLRALPSGSALQGSLGAVEALVELWVPESRLDHDRVSASGHEQIGSLGVPREGSRSRQLERLGVQGCRPLDDEQGIPSQVQGQVLPRVVGQVEAPDRVFPSSFLALELESIDGAPPVTEADALSLDQGSGRSLADRPVSLWKVGGAVAERRSSGALAEEVALRGSQGRSGDYV